MTYWDKKIVREQIDTKLSFLKDYASFGMPPQGWIKTVRKALGLSTSQLGRKAGIDQSRVSRLENAERNGNLKLSSLQRIAKGLNMQFVYGFVPEKDLEAIVKRQAEAVALKRLKILNNTMALEKQSLSDEEQKKVLEEMVQKILIEQPKDFWD